MTSLRYWIGILTLAGIFTTPGALAGPIHDAAWDGDLGQVKRLIVAGADVNAKDVNELAPLYLSAANGHTAVVEFLIGKGANVNVRNTVRATPLHAAAREGHEAVAELLITNGAEVNAESHNEGTPLHWAAKNGHTAVVKLLIANGADIHRRAIAGTPLSNAVRLGQTAVVELLMEKGATFHDALHMAARSGHVDIVVLLIAKGHDVNAKDSRRRTPLHYALKYNHKEIAELLRRHGAKD